MTRIRQMIWNTRGTWQEVPLNDQASTLRGAYPQRVPSSQADVLGREPDEDEDIDGEPVGYDDSNAQAEDTRDYTPPSLKDQDDDPNVSGGTHDVSRGKRGREYNSISNLNFQRSSDMSTVTNKPFSRSEQRMLALIANTDAGAPRKRLLTDDQRRRILVVMRECCTQNDSDKVVLNSLSDADLTKLYRHRASAPVAGGLTLNQHALRGGNRNNSEVYLPPTPVETLAADRRRELAANAGGGTDQQYGKPDMGQPGNRSQQATSTEASTLRDPTPAKGETRYGPTADGPVSPLEDGNYSQFEDFVPARQLLSPQDFLDQYVNSVVPEDEMTTGVTPGAPHDTGAVASLAREALESRQAMMPPGIVTGNTAPEGTLRPAADPMGLAARREQLRRQGIDC